MWELDTNIVQYLPDWFRKIRDMQAICKTEGEQFAALAEGIHSVADNFFFQKMDETAVQEWEKVFDIIPNPALETLEFRRLRLINRISTQPPFTLAFLYQKLDEIIGVGKWKVEIDYPNYTLYIQASSENQGWANEVIFTVNKIKPAHIAYVSKTLTMLDMTLNEAVSRSENHWNYRLGAWGLGVHPFVTTKALEVVVLPDAYSIQPQLLKDSAEAVVAAVASARINGTVSITNLTKYATENVATIQYTLTEAQAKAVTLLELLDTAGNVLTTSPVYIPITGEAVLTHEITVKEAGTNG